MEATCFSETCLSTYHTVLHQKPEVYIPALILFYGPHTKFSEKARRELRKEQPTPLVQFLKHLCLVCLFLMHGTVNMPLSCLYRWNVTDSLQVGPAFNDTKLLFSAESTSLFS
jgi:hypothetical protein